MNTTTIQQISDSWKRTSENVASIAVKARRSPDDITIVAVSKQKPAEYIRAGIDAGIRHFGENKIQEAIEKLPQFKNDKIIRHCIGHVQSNKVRFLPELFDLIQTLDAMKTAHKIDSIFRENNAVAEVLVQVNISYDSAKYGLDPAIASDFIGELLTLSNIKCRGFMTIGPNTDSRDEIRKAFKKMFALSENIYQQFIGKLSTPELSMGMSNDYDIAIQEGATFLRMGQAIFGERG